MREKFETTRLSLTKDFAIIRLNQIFANILNDSIAIIKQNYVDGPISILSSGKCDKLILLARRDISMKLYAFFVLVL